MIRLARPEDHAFIASSWLQSYSSSDWATMCTPHGDTNVTRCNECGGHKLRYDRQNGVMRWRAGDSYWAGHRQLIRRLIASSNVSVSEAEDGLIDGWICRGWQEPVLHFVYVRQSARGKGVARELVADLAERATKFTHWPRGLQARKLPREWVHDVYPLLRAA